MSAGIATMAQAAPGAVTGQAVADKELLAEAKEHGRLEQAKEEVLAKQEKAKEKAAERRAREKEKRKERTEHQREKARKPWKGGRKGLANAAKPKNGEGSDGDCSENRVE